MKVYAWMEEQKGKEMLSFLEDLSRQVSSIPASGSLAIGMGKCLGDAIRLKSEELQIPRDEAVDHFHVSLKLYSSFF